MKILSDLQQGSDSWHAHRATARNASEAAVMLGEHPDVKRNEMLAVRATGIERDVSEFQQRIFDKGHQFEALARPLAEKLLGEDLYPCVGTDDSGQLSASFDGITMDETTGWEHKWLSAALRAAMFDGCTGADLPIYHQIQLEQQCAVGSLQRSLFTASEWAGDQLIEERHCWYTPNPELRARIVAGWAQFDVDVEAYRANPPTEVLPPAPARRMDALPSLRVTATGMVTESNLSVWAAAARATLAGINRELRTDEDFAEAESNIKGCTAAEERCGAAAQAILDQTATVADTLRELDTLREDFRRARLDLDKLVKARKETVKGEIVAAGKAAVVAHFAAINASLGQHAIAVPADAQNVLATAIKGLRTMATLQNAVDTAVAAMKIAASQRADQVRAAVAAFDCEVGTFATLFPDRVQLCATKAPEDLRNLMVARINEHQRQQEAKLEAERQRIRKEEQDRADREAREAADAEKRAEAKRAEQAATTHPNGAPMYSEQVKENGDRVMLDEHGNRSVFCDLDEVDPMPASQSGLTRKPAARVKLGDICAAIAPLSIDAAGLASLGFVSVGTERAAKLYNAADMVHILNAIRAHINHVEREARWAA